ncbi:MAG TPA: hypothetical protein VMU58_13200 [Gaiellaceae bacterium]|nr:hypothetical protein [Gaiellaceae bacterium]
MIALGLVLAVASAAAINGGYALQHSAASALPPLSLRRPVHSLLALFRNRWWIVGFVGGIVGWAMYVAALALAPLSLVQAAAAGGIAVLAIGGARLTAAERVGVTGALCGLALLGLSLGSHPPTGHGAASSVAVWMIVSVAAAALVARVLPRAAGLGTAAGILYAAGDVGTKGALGGGARLLFVPALLACHGVAFVCMQLAFQRGGRLASAGLAVLWTNALPIVAGMLLFGEVLPGGWPGAARIAAFALVVVGAVALSRREPGADLSGGLTPGDARA